MTAEGDPEPRLPVAGHLEELRRRLAICLFALAATISLSFTQVNRIVQWLQQPIHGLVSRFAFFSPTEPLIAYVKVAVLAGVLLAMPIILGQLWGFVRSGLTRQERAAGAAFIGWGSALFVTGAAFAYYVLLPASLRLLLGIGTAYFEPMISIEAYLSFVTTLGFWCGVVFELPAVLFLLAKVGVVTPQWLRQQRAYAVLVLVIIAAVVTPTTDPVNLLLLAVPMILLYEASILVVRWGVPHAPRGAKR